MEMDYAQLGITGVALILIIKELFSFLKTVVGGNKKTDLSETMSMLLTEVKLQNNNHLHHIEKDMRTLAENVPKQIELLARIEGKLSR